MKKLLLSMAAIAMAMTANATIYVVGSGEGLTWELPGKAYEAQADGTYVLEIKNLTAFKFATGSYTGWDDDGFNAHAYATGATTFGAAVYQTGQTLPIVPWGDNQEVPWTGDYTITIDLTNMTMKAVTNTPQPTNAPAVYIRGDMNGWGSGDQWKFTNVSYGDNQAVYTWSGTINAGQSFKMADANWGGINYTTGGVISTFDSPIPLTYNVQQNSSFTSTFTGTITLNITNISGHLATATFAMGEGPIVPEPEVPEHMYVIGSIPGDAWNIKTPVEMMDEGDGIFSISKLTLENGDNGATLAYFAFTSVKSEEGNWNYVNAYRYGPAVQDTLAIIGENTVDGVGDLSWSIPAGTYDMTFNFTEKILEISAASTGVESLGVEEGKAVYYNLQGQKVANPDRGIFIKVTDGKAVKVVK